MPACRSARCSSRPAPRVVGAVGDVMTMRARRAAARRPLRRPWRSRSAVCTRNRPELLARCLRAILDAVDVAGAEVDASVLVVDNASDDDRPADVARSLGVDVVREAVPGLDVARNRAVATSRGDVIAFIDDDVVVEPTWLRTLARTFAAHPDAVAVTGGVTAFTPGGRGAGHVRGVRRVLQGLGRRPARPRRATGPAVRSVDRRRVQHGVPSPRPGRRRAVRRSAGHRPAAGRRRRPRHAGAHGPAGPGRLRAGRDGPPRAPRHARRARRPVPLVGRVVGRRAAQVVPHVARRPPADPTGHPPDAALVPPRPHRPARAGSPAPWRRRAAARRLRRPG